MTNKDVIHNIDFLTSVIDNRYPSAIRRAIIKNHDILNKEYEIYYKQLKELLDLYCEKDERGTYLRTEDGGWDIKPECIADWMKEVAELLDVEVDVQLQKVDESEFDKCDAGTYSIPTVKELVNFGFMIKEEENG